jgi:hypothetical protein
VKFQALIIVQLFFAYLVYAQDPYAVNLPRTNGLPARNVYDIKQDSKGYVWIADNEGLSRFNGSYFRNYKSAQQSSYPGSCISEDYKGRIWYENFDGYLYYVENDSLKSLRQNKPVQYIPFGLSADNLFVIQDKGVDVFSIRTLELITSVTVPVFRIEHACMFKQAYFLFSNDTLYRIDKNYKVEKSFVFAGLGMAVKQIYANDDYLFAVSKLNETKKLYKLNYEMQIIDILDIPEVNFIQSCNSIDNKIWINTPSGTFIYSDKGKLLSHYFRNAGITCVTKDYQQNHWIGTTSEGIKIIPDINSLHYEPPGIHPEKIIEFGSGFLIACRSGDIYSADNNFQKFSLIYQSHQKNEIYCLFHDAFQDKIYFSSRGFTKLNSLTKNTEEHKNLAVKELIRIDDSYLAIAASGYAGLVKISDNPSEWDGVFNLSADNTGSNYCRLIGEIRAKTVTYDQRDKIIYIGSNKGLFSKSLYGETEIKLNGESFFANRLIYLNDKLFALSTRGALYEINRNGNFHFLNPKFRAEQSEIKNIKLISGKLYALTDRAIYEYDESSGAARKMGPAGSAYEAKDFTIHQNRLILLTSRGIISLPFKNEYGGKMPKFYINSVSAGDKSVDTTEELVFQHFRNSISIHYSVLDYGDRSFDRLFYSINGSRKTGLPEKSTRLDLPLLAPGDYTIEFYMDDVLVPHSISFKILQPVWKRWWFIVLLLLISFSAIYAYYLYQTRLLKKQVRLLNEKVELEQNLHKSIMRTIKSQMNPHFFYNALNTIQAFIFTNDKNKANAYLAKFSKLTRLILEQSEKETITIAEEAETLRLYLELEKMRFNDDFHYILDLDEINNKESVELPPMLIQPYIENAVKHGLLHKEKDKKLSVKFSLNNNLLAVIIEDNGIGRKKAAELKKIKDEKFASFSTKANEKRLEILNKTAGSKMGVEITDKFDSEKNAAGTKVVLTILLS